MCEMSLWAQRPQGVWCHRRTTSEMRNFDFHRHWYNSPTAALSKLFTQMQICMLSIGNIRVWLKLSHCHLPPPSHLYFSISSFSLLQSLILSVSLTTTTAMIHLVNQTHIGRFQPTFLTSPWPPTLPPFNLLPICTAHSLFHCLSFPSCRQDFCLHIRRATKHKRRC